MYERSETCLKFVAWWYNNQPHEHLLYSPIAYMAPAERNYGLPGDFKFWEKLDKAAISRSDVLWVLMLDGVADSTGVRAEVAYAQKSGKPVELVYLTEDYPIVRSLTEAATMNYGWEWHGN
jgi:hypothetical protein